MKTRAFHWQNPPTAPAPASIKLQASMAMPRLPLAPDQHLSILSSRICCLQMPRSQTSTSMCPNTSKEGTLDLRVTAHAPIPFPWGTGEKHTRVVPTGPDSSPEQEGESLKRVGRQAWRAGTSRRKGGGEWCVEQTGVQLEDKDFCSLSCGPFKIQPAPHTTSPSPETY